MYLLYRLGIYAYYFLIFIISPFHQKASLWIKGRRNIFKHLSAQLAGNEAPLAWFHCASLGEFEQARPVMEGFKLQFPAYKILLTFFSPSGYEVRKNYPLADIICYMPIDTPANAKKFIAITQPSIVLFTKYEFWPCFIQEIHRKKILLISFSAIFCEKQLFFRSYGTYFLEVLKKINHIFVQEPNSFELLSQKGIHHTSVAGDTRFDRVSKLAALRSEVPKISTFKSSYDLLVAGSTWNEDIDILMPILTENTHYKIIIAPHEIDEPNLRYIESKSSKKCIRYSNFLKQPESDAQILLLDNVGMLSKVYAYATIAYIGGGFGKGIHNTIEAAVYGVPVIFGPQFKKFNEAKEMIELGCAFSIQNKSEFQKQLEALTNSNQYRRAAGLAKYYVQSRLGASDKILDYCKLKLK